MKNIMKLASIALVLLFTLFGLTNKAAAAIIIKPTANEAERFNIKATHKATIGKITNWEKKPTKKSFGVFNTLIKSLTERPRPSPNIINAKQIGAIFVTISINYIFIFLNYIKSTINIKFNKTWNCKL